MPSSNPVFFHAAPLVCTMFPAIALAGEHTQSVVEDHTCLDLFFLALLAGLTLFMLVRTLILRKKIATRSLELIRADKALKEEIRERRRAQQELDLERAYFSQLFANSPQGIILIDRKGSIVDLNTGFEELFGISKPDLAAGYAWKTLIPREYLQEAVEMRRTVLKGKSITRETVRLHKKGYPIPVSMIGYPVHIKDKIEAVFYIYSDISERKSFEQQLTTQAYYDSLTGLPNRSLFLDRLSRAIARNERYRKNTFALILLDLDRFKRINDSLGHHAGDELLAEIGSRLQQCVRTMDTVARLGGDEFGILIEDLVSVRETLQVISRIQDLLHRPCLIQGNTIHISAGIGIVADVAGYSEAGAMLRDGDIAMYRAKDCGEGQFKIFNKQMHAKAEESLQLETDLRRALGTDQLTLNYQPIVSVRSGDIIGFEALIRWHHPDLGPISPARFIPLAEETGLIIELGKWVISQACLTLSRWRNLPGNETLTMSVNLSTRQLKEEDLPRFVEEQLRRNSFPGEALKLEITENLLMEDTSSCIARLKALKKLGVELAVDDFGTGYSSLSYLQKFPIDQLKIDRSFVSGESATEEGEGIVRAIIDMAGHLGLEVVAEGVEEHKQLLLLRDQGCDRAQGYFFSRPLTCSDAEKLITSPQQVTTPSFGSTPERGV